MRRLRLLVALLTPLALQGCVAAALWNVESPVKRLFGAGSTPREVERAVLAHDGSLHVQLRFGEGLLHLTTGPRGEAAGVESWPRADQGPALPYLLETNGELPAGSPLVGDAEAEPRLLELLGEQPGPSLEVEGDLVVLVDEDDERRTIARLPEWAVPLPDRIPPNPSPLVPVVRVAATPFAAAADLTGLAVVGVFFVVIIGPILLLEGIAKLARGPTTVRPS